MRARTEGYYGGLRLLMAICAKFHQYCKEKHIDLPAKGNFTLAYDTNIPRQVSKQLHRGACVWRRHAAGKLHWT